MEIFNVDHHFLPEYLRMIVYQAKAVNALRSHKVSNDKLNTLERIVGSERYNGKIWHYLNNSPTPINSANRKYVLEFI